jgi:hypothetical protein
MSLPNPYSPVGPCLPDGYEVVADKSYRASSAAEGRHSRRGITRVCNLVSGYTGNGIYLSGDDAFSNNILGNYTSTDRAAWPRWAITTASS